MTYTIHTPELTTPRQKEEAPSKYLTAGATLPVGKVHQVVDLLDEEALLRKRLQEIQLEKQILHPEQAPLQTSEEMHREDTPSEGGAPTASLCYNWSPVGSESLLFGPPIFAQSEAEAVDSESIAVSDVASTTLSEWQLPGPLKESTLV